VSASPFFRLPLELRTTVYELLLTTKGTVRIPTDFLKRKSIKVKDSTTDPVILVLNKTPVLRKRKSPRRRLQRLTISIIRVCRLINEETTRIFYSRNTICFSNVRIANDFRWATDAGKANFIQDLSITTIDSDRWLEYIAKKRFSLGHDFPNLKRLTVDFCQRFHQRQLSLCATLGQHVRGLDWVHLINLDTAIDDSELHECLRPMVEESKAIGGSSPKMVLLEVTKHTIAYWWNRTETWTWKHATLWLGTRDAKSPCQPNFFIIKQNEMDQDEVYYDEVYQDEAQIYRLANDKDSPFPSLIRYDERTRQSKSADSRLHLWGEV
jgi:hypothetical protein